MGHKIHLSALSTLPKEKISKEKAIQKTAEQLEKLIIIQNKLFAQQKYSVLIILQGIDTSGKDNAVKNVFSGVNPGGCRVKSFKAPSTEEATHHFLWRVSKECPEKGMIQIFNRSHYEDILVPFVNKTLDSKEIKQRCAEINAFEKGLSQDNTILLKFYLHISDEEQLERIASRKKEEHKRWKYQKEDLTAIRKHKEYRTAYETIFENCSEAAPWHIIPSDKKWYKNYIILKELVTTLAKYPIDYPKVKLKEKPGA